jgi:PilZ domain-containing protein
MNDRRTRARQKSFLQGRVFFNNRRSSLDCLVRDFSDHGARLKVSESVMMPEVVELYIPNKDEAYRAHVQWRAGDEVGLAFDAPDGSPSIVPGAPDLLARVHRLETEVAALQRKVHELQNERRKRQGEDV